MVQGREVGAEIKNAILRLALAGHTRAEVARRLGVSFGTVNKFWPNNGKTKHDELRADLE